MSAFTPILTNFLLRVWTPRSYRSLHARFRTWSIEGGTGARWKQFVGMVPSNLRCDQGSLCHAMINRAAGVHQPTNSPGTHTRDRTCNDHQVLWPSHVASKGMNPQEGSPDKGWNTLDESAAPELRGAQRQCGRPSKPALEILPSSEIVPMTWRDIPVASLRCIPY